MTIRDLIIRYYRPNDRPSLSPLDPESSGWRMSSSASSMTASVAPDEIPIVPNVTRTVDQSNTRVSIPIPIGTTASSHFTELPTNPGIIPLLSTDTFAVITGWPIRWAIAVLSPVKAY